jgi:hypothetical protein
MSKVKEALYSVRRRAHPEGVAISGTLMPASLMIMAPIGAGLTYAAHELGQSIDPNTMRVIAIGVIGIANAVSSAVQSRALREHGYSSSFSANLFHTMTGRPFLSAVGAHIGYAAQLALLNPFNYAALVNGDEKLFMEGMGASVVASTTWSTTMNTLIHRGKIEPVVRTLRNVRKAVFRRKEKSTPEDSSQGSNGYISPAEVLTHFSALPK